MNNMKVSFIELTREWQFFEDSFVEALKRFGRDGYYVLGPNTANFEDNFASYCNYKYGITVSTGLSALKIALLAYGIGSGDEVITVANSAVATSLAISNIGAVPVFCDVKEDFLINEAQISSLITKKTKAILPVHLFGKICNMAVINEIAQQHNLVVIEDACQAHGANFIGDSLINTKAFSFYPTKNLGAMGEGGLVLTNNQKVKDFAVAYRDYGQNGRYNHVILGDNNRISALQCLFLDIKLKELDNFLSKRKIIAQKYIKELNNIKGLKINDFDNDSSYHLFVIRVFGGRRDSLKSFLTENGIDSLVHYPVSINQQPCYISDYNKAILENTALFQTEILSLPCYPFLSGDEQDYVISKIKQYFL
jgi:dTDP-4-amino-4,6-dideoxygalactose transaminase